MDEFLKNEDLEGNEPLQTGFEVKTDLADEPTAAEDTFEDAVLSETEAEPYADNASAPVYNPVKYSAAEPINNYRPMSRGLKVFSLIMAVIILLTGTCTVGYFLGRNSIKTGSNSITAADLAARPSDKDQMTEAEVYNAVKESIVGIVIYNTSGKGSQASGIVYSKDGYIVTNDHIYSEVPSAKFKIYMHDGKEYDAKYVAGDKISDIAILKIDNASLTPATFGNSDEVFYGEHVVAIGRPNNATEASSITGGVISAVNKRVQTTSSYSSRLLQTDSAINPGSSGGALVNMYGQVIGVTSSKLASVEYDAVGYAIPTTVMKRIADELIKEKKVVSRAKLGIKYTAVDSVTAEIGGYDNVGLLIDSVDEESSLYKKAEKGDVITHINGIEITRDDIVLDIIEQSSAGDSIKVTIITSDRKTKTFDAELKANISESSYTTTETLEKNPQDNNSSGNGGAFNFPQGE